MFDITKKIIIGILSFAILAGSVGLIVVPREVQAVVPVFDAAASKQKAASNLKDWAFYLKTFLEWVRQDLMKSIRDLIAKRIIDYIVDQTIQWIQGGGKPRFVTDWKTFLQDAWDIAFDSLDRELKGATGRSLCDPFSLNLRIALTPIPRFGDQVQCTLNRVVQNVKNFYTDFSKGGWIGYTESFYPANNLFGTWIIAQDELTRRQIAEAQARQNEALSGGGFLNVKGKCLSPVMERQCVEEDSGGSCLNYQDVQVGCDKYEVLTPGQTVGAALASAVTSDKDWAANIQSWSAALVNAAINRVVKEGILGIQGFVQDTLSEEPDYDPSDGTPYGEIIARDLAYKRQQFLEEPQEYLAEVNSLSTTKETSLTLAMRTTDILRTMEPLDCPSPTNPAEIQTAQSEVNRLQSEITRLNASSTQLQSIITELLDAEDEASLNATVASTTPLLAPYRTAGFLGAMTEGTARAAAEAEKQNKNTQVQATQARLNQCVLPGSEPQL